MNDELEILQCLIENRIFAPSPSALAKRLAYKGKMTIYRVMEGKVSFRVVHDVWRKLLKEFHITDDIPYFIGRVCYITKLFHNAILPEMNTKHPEWIENVLISLIDDIYVYNSDKFNKEFVPILKDLRRDEPDVYWGMAVLFYIKRRAMIHMGGLRNKYYISFWIVWTVSCIRYILRIIWHIKQFVI